MSDKYQKDEAVTWMIPAKEGYQDRKMAKWMGFILSDHYELIQGKKKTEEAKLGVEAKEEQDPETIQAYLSHSYQTKQALRLQLNYIENGRYQEDSIGYVAGFSQNMVYLKTKDDLLVIDSQLIRHAEPLEAKKWFDRD